MNASTAWFQASVSHYSCLKNYPFRERSFLKLGTGVEEFLEGCQIILPRQIGVSKILAKITKYMMGCEILGIYV